MDTSNARSPTDCKGIFMTFCSVQFYLDQTIVSILFYSISFGLQIKGKTNCPIIVAVLIASAERHKAPEISNVSKS